MGVSESEFSLPEVRRHVRLDTLHLRGTEEMSTEDVFAYFEAYPPKAVEWINDTSCEFEAWE